MALPKPLPTTSLFVDVVVVVVVADLRAVVEGGGLGHSAWGPASSTKLSVAVVVPASGRFGFRYTRFRLGLGIETPGRFPIRPLWT